MANFARFITVDFSQFDWLNRIDADVLLDVGDLSPDLLTVPGKDAQRVLSEVVRLVLDLPRNSTPLVVWTKGDSELLIHSDQTRIQFSSGVITESSVFRYRLALAPNSRQAALLCPRSKTSRARKNLYWPGGTRFRRSPGSPCWKSLPCSAPRLATTSVVCHWFLARSPLLRTKCWCNLLPGFH